LTLQAYLYRTEDDLKKVIQNGGAVQLVKGAFAERKEIAFTNLSEIDKNCLKLAEIMLSKEARSKKFYPIFGTHDDRLIDKIIKIADRNGWKKRNMSLKCSMACEWIYKTNLFETENNCDSI
jgi:proline dehydrogenase